MIRVKIKQTWQVFKTRQVLTPRWQKSSALQNSRVKLIKAAFLKKEAITL